MSEHTFLPTAHDGNAMSAFVPWLIASGTLLVISALFAIKQFQPKPSPKDSSRILVVIVRHPATYMAVIGAFLLVFGMRQKFNEVQQFNADLHEHYSPETAVNSPDYRVEDTNNYYNDVSLIHSNIASNTNLSVLNITNY